MLNLSSVRTIMCFEHAVLKNAVNAVEYIGPMVSKLVCISTIDWLGNKLCYSCTVSQKIRGK